MTQEVSLPRCIGPSRFGMLVLEPPFVCRFERFLQSSFLEPRGVPLWVSTATGRHGLWMPLPRSHSPRCVLQSPGLLRCDFRDARSFRKLFSSRVVSTVDFQDQPAT